MGVNQDAQHRPKESIGQNRNFPLSRVQAVVEYVKHGKADGQVIGSVSQREDGTETRDSPHAAFQQHLAEQQREEQRENMRAGDGETV